METIKFIEIKPNNDKNINNSLLESLNKLLNTSINDKSISKWNDSIDDIFLDHNEAIHEHNKSDPINYINDFFKQQQNIDKNDINDNTQFYDIISFDSNGNNKLNIMLINKTINSSSFISSVDDDFRKNNFNLIASTLSKYFTNSSAIFGSVFILSINLPYYTLLDQIDKIKEDQEKNIINNNDDTEINTVIEKYTKQLNEFTEIYYNFTPRQLIESFCNVCFVKIYAETKNSKSVFIYARDLMENFANNSKQITLIKSNSIAKLSYEDTIIYVKYTTPLPNSHYAILNMLNNNESTKTSENTKNNLYFINLMDSDIIFLQNQN